MAKHEYENKGPVYLTYAKYEEYRVAGTLEVGREYRIINSEELFDCTYDTTTYAEITEAITNLRLPVCTYGGRKYYYVSESNNTYEFSCCAGSKMYQITVTSGNVWSNAEASSGNITSRDATEGESIPLLELGTKVIANPEIPSGTEATQLNALKVGNGYYSAGGGGGGGETLYRHIIQFSSGNNRVDLTVESTEKTPFTMTTLQSYCKKYSDNGIVYVPCYGRVWNSKESPFTHFSCVSGTIFAYYYGGSSHTIYGISSTTFTDKVFDMEGNLV